MHRPIGLGRVGMHETNDLVAGELSYGNGAFVMTIVIPYSDIDAFAATLDTAAWRSLVTPMTQETASVDLPKFTLQYERQLKDDLIALGMTTPFVAGGADFTHMSPVGKQLFIAFVT